MQDSGVDFTNCQKRRWWIGLRRIDADFTWSDNNPVMYRNWGKNEPGTEKDCGYLRLNNWARWRSDECSEEYCFVCKSESPGNGGSRSSSTADSKSRAAAIGGSVTGAFITVAIMVVALYIYCRRRKKNGTQQQSVGQY